MTAHYEVHGDGGIPLILGYPVMASATAVDPARAVLKGYLACLTDRYRVLVMDYPPADTDEFTAQRVCDDMLAVADAAGFHRFIWWGFSWGGLVGLQLASRTDRVAALICGGWPPLDGPFKEMLRIVQARRAQRFVSFYESVQNWPEAEAIARIHCPRMTFAGSADDLVLDGVELQLAARLRGKRSQLEQQGWHVVEIEGRDHSVYTDPATLVPAVREFLDRVEGS